MFYWVNELKIHFITRHFMSKWKLVTEPLLHQRRLPLLFSCLKSRAPRSVCRCLGAELAAPPHLIKEFEGDGIRQSRNYLPSRHAWLVKWMQCIFLPISASLCFLLLCHLFQCATAMRHKHVHAPLDTCALPKRLWTYTSCTSCFLLMNWCGLASTVAAPLLLNRLKGEM